MRIPLEDIPDVKTWDPFSTPILESGIGKAQPKPYRDGIDRMRKSKYSSLRHPVAS